MKKKVITGFFWSFGERILAQTVSFVVSVILARILLPDEYGTVALVLVFINVANVFVSNGFGEALIQKKTANNVDFSTIFWCSQFSAWALYAFLFVIAPQIAAFYDNDGLVDVIRIISLKLPLASINTIQHAYVSKKMLFKKFFWSTFGGTIISGVIGIIMAYHGFGVWALVAQYLINSFMDTIILMFTVDWKPKLLFSTNSVRELLGFGWKMMLASLINTIYGEMQSLVIGKTYTLEELAFYKRGNQFPALFITNINTALGTVLFPAMSNTRTQGEVKDITRRSLQITAYVICPLMFGLIAVSRPLVIVLLTEKWQHCIPFLQLSCIAFVLQPIQTANCQAVKALGRSDIYLKMEIVKKVIGVTLLVIAIKHGVVAIAIAFVLSVGFSALISCMPNVKLLDYSYAEQFEDVFPSFALSFAMLVAIYPISLIGLSNMICLLLQVMIGAFIYTGLSAITKNASFRYLLSLNRTIKE